MLETTLGVFVQSTAPIAGRFSRLRSAVPWTGLVVVALPTLRYGGFAAPYAVERLVDLALLALALLQAATLGDAVLTRFRLRVEGAGRWPFATSVGLLVIGGGVAAVGFAGWFSPTTLLVVWAVTCLVAVRRLDRLARSAVRCARALWRDGVGAAGRGAAPLVFSAGLLVVLPLVSALGPVTSYDALMYHLMVPRDMLLRHGFFVATPHQGNYPLLGEMLFALALALGSDTLAQLMHWAAGALLGWCVWVWAAEYGGRTAGALAVAAYLTIRTTTALASLAYVDLFWALWEVGAAMALATWATSLRPRDASAGGLAELRPGWLVLAGLLIGAAIGTKYIALMSFAVVGPAVFLWAWRRRGWRGAVLASALFGGVAVAVAAPWYVKNWLWLGSPVYPHFAGLTGSGTEHEPLSARYDEAYGIGRSPLALLTLPFRLYNPADSAVFRFSHLTFDMPSPLFLLLPLLVAARRVPGVVWAVLALVGLRVVMWAVTIQDLRYVYPAFVVLCVPVGVGLAALVRRWPRRPAVASALRVAVGFALVWPLLIEGATVAVGGPLAVLAGAQTPEEFLVNHDASAGAVLFMNRSLPDGAHVLMVNDKRPYRLRHAYRPYEGLAETLEHRTDGEMWTLIRGWGITHVELGDDLRYLADRGAPAAIPLGELQAFVERADGTRLRRLFDDGTFRVFELLPESAEVRP